VIVMSSKIYKDDINLVKIFIDKWLKSFGEFEKEILKLELHSEDNKLLDDIFKYAHSIKVGSSFVGLSHITRLSFEIETALSAINKCKITVDSGLIDSLLLSSDFLKGFIKKLNERLMEPDFIGKDGASRLEFEYEQNENKVIESLQLALKECEKKDDESGEVCKNKSEEDICLEVLETEEFKNELAEGIKEQFLLENTEHIERIENDLLIRLDSNSDDREAIAEIFRTAHNIKGGTGMYLAAVLPQSDVYVSLKRFSEVIHNFESLLTFIRDNAIKFEKDLVDLSLLVMDYLELLIHSIDTEKFDDLTDNCVNESITEKISFLQSASSNAEQKATESAKKCKCVINDSKSKESATQSIRVNQDKINKMMNTISELLVAKYSFAHIASRLNLEYNLPEMSKEVTQVGAYVNRVFDELQNTIMSIRMIEVKTVFQRMPRIVRDIAQNTGKKIELSMEGDNTEIDKTIIEQISDPLVHLIRNAADHGIESPAERVLIGKSETGRLVLRAYNKNKYVYIEIEDDGKGINAELMKEKAVEKGFITSNDASRMSHNQLINLIFLPGFSTAKQITEVSGRGVGMDIVKSNIAKIKGNVTIESEVNKGTKMIIRLPLTLAVSKGLIVEVSGESYIFPLEYIAETVKIKKSQVHRLQGKCFTHLRGEVIGVEWLCRIFLLGEADEELEELNAVIIFNGEEKYAIIVDKLINEQELVVKTLEGQLAAIPGISGSTLLGNGKVVLIVNPPDLLHLARK
jgi:two-component system chemotaxis sensor kinase CheA